MKFIKHSWFPICVGLDEHGVRTPEVQVFILYRLKNSIHTGYGAHPAS